MRLGVECLGGGGSRQLVDGLFQRQRQWFDLVVVGVFRISNMVFLTDFVVVKLGLGGFCGFESLGLGVAFVALKA